ncbi:TLC domain-containing protein [Trichoderma breve]|uniref:TLC domain-containing protein n=1 Tax=Trichoderma breve TaxID=2034170 RepID=A0A9W9BCI3_9HYPO|nr:TLC domain-containing protein [Trichoderma breve]KAJ4860605.1 TLC domain-containing protein [Trichoderma breve]
MGDKIDDTADDYVGYANDPKGIPTIKSTLKDPMIPIELPVRDNVHEVVMRYRSRTIPCRTVKQTLVDSQTPVAINLLALLFLSHLIIPKSRVYTRPFFELSYYNPDTGLYANGGNDQYFIAFFVVLFTGLRHAIMSFVLCPLARRGGISKKKDVARFSEQAWNIIHYSVFWPLGLYIWYTSPYYLNMTELWTGWPSREISGTMKFYFLTQLAFWLQQMLVVHIEKQRKDYWLTIVHHFATIWLVTASYSYHFTRVGNLTLIIMDVVDLIFPLAKCAKYLGYRKLCDCLFGVFVVIWLTTRHVFFLMSTTGWTLLEPFHSPQGMICANSSIFFGFFTFLIALQGLMVIWSYAILKVAVRVLSGKNADDIRSDVGEDEMTEFEGRDPVEFENFDYWARVVYEAKSEPKVLLAEKEKMMRKGKETQADKGGLNGWECHHRRTHAISSGLYLHGQNEHKELLNRLDAQRRWTT